MFRCTLKSVDVEEIEEALAQAVGDLVGEDSEVEILSIVTSIQICMRSCTIRRRSMCTSRKRQTPSFSVLEVKGFVARRF